MRRPLTVLLFAMLLNAACAAAPPSSSEEWSALASIPGAFRRNLAGDPGKPGPFRFELKVPAGARAEEHKHSTDVRVTVVSGSMHIVIGEPFEDVRAQHYAAGTSFVVPAEAWHVEWWDEPSTMQGEGEGPMLTTRRE